MAKGRALEAPTVESPERIERTAEHAKGEWRDGQRGPWGSMPDPAPTREPVQPGNALRAALRRRPRIE